MRTVPERLLANRKSDGIQNNGSAYLVTSWLGLWQN